MSFPFYIFSMSSFVPFQELTSPFSVFQLYSGHTCSKAFIVLQFQLKMCKIIHFFLPMSGRYFAHHCILMPCSIKTFGRAGFIQAATPDVNLPY